MSQGLSVLRDDSGFMVLVLGIGASGVHRSTCTYAAGERQRERGAYVCN